MSERHLSKLTAQTLKEHLLEDIDVWPYIHPDTITVRRFYEEERAADRAVRDFQERRILLLSWFLAALLGIMGNLFASSLFGLAYLRDYRVSASFGLAFLGIGILFYLYFPVEFRHTVIIKLYEENIAAGIPTYKKLMEFPELKGIDAIKKGSNFFYELLDKYKFLFALCLVRDIKYKSKLQVLKISDIHTPGFDITAFELELELKTKRSVLNPAIYHMVSRDLSNLLESLTENALRVDWHEFSNEESWKKNGRNFLVEIQTWNFRKISEQIMNQILTSWKPE